MERATGRPHLEATEKRTHMLVVRLSQGELEMVREAAARVGHTQMSVWVRQLALLRAEEELRQLAPLEKQA